MFYIFIHVTNSKTCVKHFTLKIFAFVTVSSRIAHGLKIGKWL